MICICIMTPYNNTTSSNAQDTTHYYGAHACYPHASGRGATSESASMPGRRARARVKSGRDKQPPDVVLSVERPPQRRPGAALVKFLAHPPVRFAPAGCRRGAIPVPSAVEIMQSNHRAVDVPQPCRRRSRRHALQHPSRWPWAGAGGAQLAFAATGQKGQVRRQGCNR
jgi:hypothetical protein